MRSRIIRRCAPALPALPVTALLAALAVTAGLAVGGPATAAPPRDGAPASTSASTSARQAPGDGSAFTVAVVPDTQGEVFGSDPRMRQRFQWLANRREALDLRFAAQVGDFTNWGWVDRPQLVKASDAVRPLESAGVPFSVAVGNHDTRAVGWDGHGGYGGSAYVDNPECVERFSPAECKTELLVRHTEEINQFLDAGRFGAVRGVFEAGKIDNLYSIFRAGGKSWMVLDLELWPRPEAVDWARRVVAAHPDTNVIVNTHSYLTARDKISTSAEYGTTSPRYVWDRLVSRYPNIKIVISGHTGSAGMRIDQGRAGNKVVALRTNFSRTTTNPTRLVTIRPGSDELLTRIVAPYTHESMPRFRAVVTGMDFVG